MITTSHVYDHFRIPPNLQRHMLRAAAAAGVVLDNWTGSRLSEVDILSTLLVHDLGNIVKADYDRSTELLEEETPNVDYWRGVQAETIERYGSDDHEVTAKMARSIGLSDRILDLLNRKIFTRNEETVRSRDWELKICAYTDQRIGPFGILSLDDRFDELRRRYKGRQNSSINHPRGKLLISAAYEIEHQVMQHCTLVPSDLTDDRLEPQLGHLREYALQARLPANDSNK